MNDRLDIMLRFLENKKLSLLFLAAISLGLFAPTLLTGLIDLDDTTMILDLNTPGKYTSFKALFVPTHARYYRPILMLSFILESRLWHFNYPGYHLTNIILHIFNAMLVYFISLTFFKDKPFPRKISFAAALLFLVHPLSCESVAWISGRTDLLSAFFSLSAILIFRSNLPVKPLLVMIPVLLGLFSKENTIAVIPIILVMVFCSTCPASGFKTALKSLIPWTLLFTVTVMVYLFFRFQDLPDIPSLTLQEPLKSTLSGAGAEVTTAHASTLYTLMAATGFYLKKLLIPWPLSLAISAINVQFYFFVSAIVAMACTLLVILKKYALPIRIVVLIISFSPALPVAVTGIAWMPLAERYLYLSLALFCFFAGELMISSVKKYPDAKRIITLFAAAVILTLAVTTAMRVNVWQNELTLWKDTWEKNPDNGKVLFMYGNTLTTRRGGLVYFQKAATLPRDDEWKHLSLLALGSHAVHSKKYQKAVQYIKQAIPMAKKPRDFYTAVSLLKTALNKEGTDPHELQHLIIRCYESAYARSPNPKDLYNLYLLAVEMNDQTLAEKYLKQLTEDFPHSRLTERVKAL